MRSITELLKSEEKVWGWFDNEELCEEFFHREEGFRFGGLPREKWKTGHVIAVHRDGTMGHLSLFVWLMSFSGGDCPINVDYRRFIAENEDFLCRRPHLACRMTFAGSAGA